MRESCCGKNCAECLRREELNCPGCRPEEGSRFPTSCVIAACCHRSGHETCESCIHKQNFCQTLKEKDDYPQRHIREQEAEQRRREEERRQRQERRERAGFLLRSFNALCIIWAISCGLDLCGMAVGEGSLLDYGAELLGLGILLVIYRMAKINPQYKYAAFFSLAANVVDLIRNLMGETGVGLSILFILLMLPGLYGDWLQMHTHGEVLWGIHEEMAGKWEKLADWYALSSAALLGGTALGLILPIFLLFVPVGTIGAVVVALIEVWYLFRTRTILRTYLDTEPPIA